MCMKKGRDREQYVHSLPYAITNESPSSLPSPFSFPFTISSLIYHKSEETKGGEAAAERREDAEEDTLPSEAADRAEEGEIELDSEGEPITEESGRRDRVLERDIIHMVPLTRSIQQGLQLARERSGPIMEEAIGQVDPLLWEQLECSLR